MKRFLLLVLLIISVGFASDLFAQKEFNNWYFGNFAGLDFNPGAPVPHLDGAMAQQEGCATISDKDGNLLFYTDGIYVWNRTHVLMPDGSGLLGDPSSTQSAIIVPAPGSNKRYYIFTVDNNGGANGLNYTVIDMALAGGLGDVVPGKKNVPMTSPVSEKITAAWHVNGVDIWVISHEYGSNKFLSYRLTPSGLNMTPVVSAVGTVHSVLLSNHLASGAIRVSPEGKHLALAIHKPVNQFELYDFDNGTGKISNPVIMQDYENAYGVEFSMSGELLYGTCIGLDVNVNSRLYQWSLDGDAGFIIGSVDMVGFSSSMFGNIQMAPDGNIYVARFFSPYLGAILSPETENMGCNYVDNALHLDDRLSTFGLPNFMQPYTFKSGWDDAGHCFLDSTSFELRNNLPVDSLVWDFGDPGSGTANYSRLRSPKHMFSAPGDYSVTVTVYFKGTSEVISQEVTIRPVPTVSLGPDVTICAGDHHIFDPGSGYNTYVWQDGSVGQTYDATIEGEYWVRVTNQWGCPNSDTALLFVNPAPDVDAGPNQTIANGTNTLLSGAASGTSGDYSYHWKPEALVENPDVAVTQTKNLNSTTVFTLEVTDNVTGCEGDDKVTIHVAGEPLGLNVSATPENMCVAQPVQLHANALGGAGSYTYQWSSNPAGFTSALENPVVTPSQTTTYIVTVDDGYNTATDSVKVVLFDLPQADAGADESILHGTNIQLHGSAINGSGQYEYHWEPADKLVDADEAEPWTVNLTESTNFILEVTDKLTGCSHTDDVLVEVTGTALAIQAIVLPDTLCAGESAQLQAVVDGGSGSYMIQWSSVPAGFASDQYSVTVTPAQTTQYIVEADDGYNTVSASVTVVVHPLPVTEAGDDVEIAHGIKTQLYGVATGGSGFYHYHWSPEALVQNPDVAQPLTENIYENTQFTLTVTDAVTGCMTSDMMTVSVTGTPVAVAVTATPQVICVGESVQIEALGHGGSGNYAYSWVSDPAGFTSNQQNPVVAPLNTTLYTVTVDDGYNTNTAQVTVTVNPLPEISLGDDIMIPHGASTQLASQVTGGSGMYSYQWEPAEYLQNVTVPNPITTNLYNSTIFTLTVTDQVSQCTQLDQVQVIINGQPLDLSVQADDAVLCVGEPATLHAQGVGGSGNYSFVWTSRPQGFVSQQADPVFNPQQNTTFIVQVDDGYNSSVDSVIVVVNPIPVVDAGNNAVIPHGANTILQGSASGVGGPWQYLWSPADSVLNPQVQLTQTKKLSTTNIFTFKVTDAVTQCSASDQVMVQVVGSPLGVNVNASGTDVCFGGTVHLLASASGGSENFTYSWTSKPAGFSSAIHNPSTVPQETTTYYVNVSDGYNVAKDSIKVVVNLLPDVDAGEPTAIVFGETTQLHGLVTGSSSYAYSWEPAAMLVNPQVSDPTTLPLEYTTEFTVTVTDLNTGCQQQDNVTVIVFEQHLAVEVAVSAMEVCKGESVTLSANASGGSGTYTYYWSANPAGFVSHEAEPVVTPSQNTTYYVIVNDGYDVAVAELNVVVHDLIVDAGPDLEAVYETSVNLHGTAFGGSGSYAYHWEPAHLMQNPDVADPLTIDLTTSTEFVLQITDLTTGCSGADTIMVFVPGGALMANIVYPDVVCYGSTAQMSAEALGGSGEYIYHWSSDDNSWEADGQHVEVTPLKTSNYTVSITDGYHTALRSVTLIVLPVPVVNITSRKAGNDEEWQRLDAGFPGAVYYWSTGEDTREILAQNAGEYWVEVTVDGCVGMDTLNIIKASAFGLVDVPSAFSPNEDGHNDVLFARGYGVKSATFNVYNRIGELMFSTDNITEGWDGRRNGVEQPGEVYVYTLIAKMTDGRSVEKKGTVTLLR